MSTKLVSFVVLNWNGLEDTLTCLESIKNQTYENFEIIVVDNGSSANEKSVLEKQKGITFVSLPQNTGFTGGQIEALKHVKGDYIALINNDAVIAKDWCDVALSSFTNSKTAVVGGRAYHWNEAQKAYSLENDYSTYQVMNLQTAHAKTLQIGSTSGSVNSISGSAVMIKKSVVDKVGYFYDKFFAYYEESDLFARMKRAGYKVIYNPKLSTWHKVAQSTKSNPSFYLYFMHRNRFIFAVRNFDRYYLMRFLGHYFLNEWLKALAHIIRHPTNPMVEQKMLVKAGARNLINFIPVLLSRHSIKKLGKTYSKKLLNDLGEPITIIITCYNYESFVTEAIHSALSQSIKPYEVIVINDGSTDNSISKIQNFRKQITIIDKKNEGVIATKNLGLKHAKADWVVFLDADDILDEKYLATLSKKQRTTNADVVYSGMRFIGNEKGTFPSRPYSQYSLLKGNYINNSALMKTPLVAQAGGYKEKMSAGYEDWELYVSLSELGATFAHVNKPLLFYRRHGENSRDIEAKKKVGKAKQNIRLLHPSLFTLTTKLKDIIYPFLHPGNIRTPLQLARDTRYKFISRLDNASKNSKLIEKGLATSRLASNGEYSKIADKIAVNFRRLKDKVIKK